MLRAGLESDKSGQKLCRGQDFDTQMRVKNLFLIFILKTLHKKVAQKRKFSGFYGNRN